MRFPLGDWIDQHSALPHNLAVSGMRGSLRSTERVLQRPEAADVQELSGRLSRLLGVRREALVLTHGATESNALVLGFLAHHLHARGVRRLRLGVTVPEYPVMTTAGSLLGFEVVAQGPSEVDILSRPNNPSGASMAPDDLFERPTHGRSLVVDETFREFTPAPSLARLGRDDLWVTGTFTKAYGADHIRVGYVAPPADLSESFAQAHVALADGLATNSVSSAVALLRNRERILGEARRLFRTNARYLRERVDDRVEIAAPLWFDRGFEGSDAERLTRAALRRGILVCPGRFFGDPSGVRICLTRRSFPRDLEAYLEVRARFAR